MAITMGSADIGLGDILAMLRGRWEAARAGAKMHLLWNIRLPRVIFGLVGGFGATLAIGLGWGLWGGKCLPNSASPLSLTAGAMRSADQPPRT